MSNFGQEMTIDIKYAYCSNQLAINVPMLEANCDLETDADKLASCKLAFTDNVLSFDSAGTLQISTGTENRLFYFPFYMVWNGLNSLHWSKPIQIVDRAALQASKQLKYFKQSQDVEIYWGDNNSNLWHLTADDSTNNFFYEDVIRFSGNKIYNYPYGNETSTLWTYYTKKQEFDNYDYNFQIHHERQINIYTHPAIHNGHYYAEHLRISLNETFDKYTTESDRFKFFRTDKYTFYLGVMVVDPKDYYGEECAEVITIIGGLDAKNFLVIKNSEDLNITKYDDFDLIDKYVKDGVLKNADSPVISVCHSDLNDLTKFNISINKLNAKKWRWDRMTADERDAIFVENAENRLRVDKDYVTNTVIHLYQLRIKSTDNQHGATTDIFMPLNLIFCDSATTLTLKTQYETGTAPASLLITQTADADGLIELTYSTFSSFYDSRAHYACIMTNVSYNVGGNDSDAIKWDEYNFKMIINYTKLGNDSDRNVSFSWKLPHIETSVVLDITFQFTACARDYLYALDHENKVLDTPEVWVFREGSLSSGELQLNMANLMKFYTNRYACYPNKVSAFNASSDLRISQAAPFDVVPLNLNRIPELEQIVYYRPNLANYYPIVIKIEDAHGFTFVYTINFVLCTGASMIGRTEPFVNGTISFTYSTGHNKEKYYKTEYKSLEGVKYQVYNLAQHFQMNGEISAFYAKLDEKAVAFCGKLNITLYNSPQYLGEAPCTHVYTNALADVRVTDFNKEFVLNLTNTEDYLFTDLLITGVPDYVIPNNPIQFYAKATSQWGVQECFPLEITMCGREIITEKYPGGQILNMKDYFGGIREISYNETLNYFNITNLGSECNITRSIIFMRDGNLTDANYDRFIYYKFNESGVERDKRTLNLDLGGFHIAYTPFETIFITMRTFGGATATTKVVFQFEESIAILQAAIDAQNRPPFVLGYNMMQPWICNIRNQTEPIAKYMSPQLIDAFRDRIVIKIQNFHNLTSFATIIENEQVERIKTFELAVDKTLVEKEDLGMHTFGVQLNDHLRISEVYKFQIEIVNETAEAEEEKKEEVAKPSPTNFDFLARLGIYFDFDDDSKKDEEEVEEVIIIEPSISISGISPLGKISVAFNQPFKLPKNMDQVDYSKVFQIGLRSLEDGSIVMGEFQKPSNDDDRRNLAEDNAKKEVQIKGCHLDDCLALQKSFSWEVSDHTSKGFDINVQFDKPSEVSKSTEGQDKLHFEISEPKFFISEKDGLFMELKNIKNQGRCKGWAVFCSNFPPIMKSQEEVDTVEGAASNLHSTIEALTSGNLLLAIFVGVSIEQLFGMIRLIQVLMLQAVIQINYPAHVTYFYSLCVLFADMDILNGPYWYEFVFDFLELEPFNDQFSNFGTDDTNVITNTGSMFLIFVSMVFFYILWSILTCFAKRNYKKPCCRKMGVYASSQLVFKTPAIHMLVEGYTDLILSIAMNAIVICRSFVSWPLFASTWLNNYSDITLVVVTFGLLIVILILPFWVRYHILKNFKNLKDKDVQEEFGVFYEEYKVDTKTRALFSFYSMMRKLALVLILVFLDHLPWLQALLIMPLQTFWFCFMVNVSPFNSKFMNKVEIWNELTVIICTHFNMNFMMEAPNLTVEQNSSLKDKIGWGLIGTIILNISSNLILVGYSSLLDTWKSMVALKKSYERDSNKSNRLKYSELVSENVEDKTKIQRYTESIEEQKAIDFCKGYIEERRWCKENNLDVKDLPEEQQYQEHLKKFKFRQKKALVNYQMQIKQTIVKKVKNQQQKDIKNKVFSKNHAQGEELFAIIDRQQEATNHSQNKETKKAKASPSKFGKLSKKVYVRKTRNIGLATITENGTEENDDVVVTGRKEMLQKLKESNILHQETQMQEIRTQVIEAKAQILSRIQQNQNDYSSDLLKIEGNDSNNQDLRKVAQFEKEKLENDQQTQILDKNKSYLILDAYNERINDAERRVMFDKILTLAENESDAGSDQSGQMEQFEFADSESENQEILEIKDTPVEDDNQIDSKEVKEAQDDKKKKKKKHLRTEKKKKKQSKTINALGLIVVEESDAKEQPFSLLFQGILEIPYFKKHLNDKLNFLVNIGENPVYDDQQQLVSLCEILNVMYNQTFSDGVVKRHKKQKLKYDIDPIIKFLNFEGRGCEEFLYRLFQKMHEESRLSDCQQLNFKKFMTTDSSLSEQIQIESYLMSNRSQSIVSRTLTHLLRNTLSCTACNSKTFNYQEQILLDLNCDNNKSLAEALQVRCEGQRKVFWTCTHCKQMKLHLKKQVFMVTPEILIVRVQNLSQFKLSKVQIRSIEQLNNSLLGKNDKYLIPEMINASDVEDTYPEEYRNLVRLLDNVTEDISAADMNSILSTDNAFALQDDKLDYQFLKTHIPTSEPSSLTSPSLTIDLSPFTDTKHVRAINEGMESKRNRQEKFDSEFQETLAKMKEEDRQELIKLKGIDESGKRTVEEQFSKLTDSELKYELFTVTSGKSAHVLKEMPSGPPLWYKYANNSYEQQKDDPLEVYKINEGAEFLFFKKS